MNRFSTFWQDSVNLLLGVVLFFSPWLLDFASVEWAAWNAYAVGAAIVVMALAAIFAYQQWEEWITGVLGVWLIIAPWVLGFSTHEAAMMAHVVIGIATVVLAYLANAGHGSGHVTAGR